MKPSTALFLAVSSIATTCIFSEPAFRKTQFDNLHVPEFVANSPPPGDHSCSQLGAPNSGLNHKKRKRQDELEIAEVPLSEECYLSSLTEVRPGTGYSLDEPSHRKKVVSAGHSKSPISPRFNSSEWIDTISESIAIEFVNFQVLLKNIRRQLGKGEKSLGHRELENSKVWLLLFKWPEHPATMAMRWIGVRGHALAARSLYAAFLSLESHITHYNMFLMRLHYNERTAIESTNLLFYWLKNQIFSPTNGRPILGITEYVENEKVEFESVQNALINYFCAQHKNHQEAQPLAIAIIEHWYLKEHQPIWLNVFGPANEKYSSKGFLKNDKDLSNRILNDIIQTKRKKLIKWED